MKKRFKLICSCGNEIVIKNEAGISERDNTLNNSEIFFQVRTDRTVKILCDKCGNLAFISY